MNRPVRIAITGASGDVGYQLVFRIAAGDMLGPNQPVILQLIDIPEAMDALRGVLMELEDAAFPQLKSAMGTADLEEGFDQARFAILAGAPLKRPDIPRAELLAENGRIFGPQGRALNAAADRNVKVLVVGSPVNTNCLIARAHAPDLRRENFTALTRLDHNRAVAQLARKTGFHNGYVKRVTVWGNRTATLYPDISHAMIAGHPADEKIDHEWYINEFIPTVQQRDNTIVQTRGASSAATAASAAIDHLRDWELGTEEGSWVSMGVPSDGTYGIAPGVIYSFPCICDNGDYRIVPDLEVSDFSRARMDATDRELREERAAIEHLLP